jgi:hypothetical protein
MQGKETLTFMTTRFQVPLRGPIPGRTIQTGLHLRLGEHQWRGGAINVLSRISWLIEILDETNWKVPEIGQV